MYLPTAKGKPVQEKDIDRQSPEEEVASTYRLAGQIFTQASDRTCIYSRCGRMYSVERRIRNEDDH